MLVESWDFNVNRTYDVILIFSSRIFFYTRRKKESDLRLLCTKCVGLTLAVLYIILICVFLARLGMVSSDKDKAKKADILNKISV
jgi:hypothetical protein